MMPASKMKSSRLESRNSSLPTSNLADFWKKYKTIPERATGHEKSGG